MWAVHQYCLPCEAVQAHMILQPVKSLLNIHLQEFKRIKNKNGGRSLH